MTPLAFDRQIWILITGRLLLQLGTGFTLFYAAIFFTNQVGLSAAAVGFGLGSQSILGVVGRVLGGSMVESPRWGRRKTLLLSAAIAGIASFVLAISDDFWSFLGGNLLIGLGIGLYWPAAETAVADLASPEQRHEAFALNRLADSVGLGLGIVLGGWIIAVTSSYRSLFILDGISYFVFFAIILGAIYETRQPHAAASRFWQDWRVALGDRLLMTFAIVNVLFTTYLALINSALPLYFTNFVRTPEFVRTTDTGQGFDTVTISSLFAWHIVLAALCQLPIARALSRWSNPQALIGAALFWAIGFGFVWLTGATNHPLIWAGLALGIMAIAMDIYNPASSALVVGLAPTSLRGIYLAVNSLCWSGGYFLGPTIGGWAMGQSKLIADRFWLLTACTVIGVIAVLLGLDRVSGDRRL